MNKIITHVTIENPSEPDKKISCHAFVDIDVSHMTLPLAWKERLGKIIEIRRIEIETATQKTTEGIVCGPVRIQIEGFRPVFSEVVFIKMEPEDGDCEPLVGYLVLEQSQAAWTCWATGSFT